jgi:hypothetical protein
VEPLGSAGLRGLVRESGEQHGERGLNGVARLLRIGADLPADLLLHVAPEGGTEKIHESGHALLLGRKSVSPYGA